MKKPAQISFIVIIFFAINIQLVNAKAPSNEKPSKVDRFQNSEFLDTLENSEASIKDAEMAYTHSLELSTIQSEIQNLNEILDEYVLVQRETENDLEIVDDEETLQVENWMLNPSNWLCNM